MGFAQWSDWSTGVKCLTQVPFSYTSLFLNTICTSRSASRWIVLEGKMACHPLPDSHKVESGSLRWCFLAKKEERLQRIHKSESEICWRKQHTLMTQYITTWLHAQLEITEKRNHIDMVFMERCSHPTNTCNNLPWKGTASISYSSYPFSPLFPLFDAFDFESSFIGIGSRMGSSFCHWYRDREGSERSKKYFGFALFNSPRVFRLSWRAMRKN